jgi:hypothetical protein
VSLSIKNIINKTQANEIPPDDVLLFFIICLLHINIINFSESRKYFNKFFQYIEVIYLNHYLHKFQTIQFVSL